MFRNVLRRFIAMAEAKPILSFLIALAAVSSLLVPNFFSAYNLSNILIQSSVLAVVACGVTFVVLNGGIDFSSTAVIALSSVVGSSIMTENGGFLGGSPWAIPAALLTMLAIGILVGAINGFSVVVLRMPSFIVTLATMTICSGLAVWYTNAETIMGIPEPFLALSTGFIGPVPVPLIIVTVVVGLCQLVLSNTIFGRQTILVGSNPKTAHISGIPVKVTVFTLFVVSGVLSGFAGALMTARMESGASGHASQMFIDIIASIVIGGTSIFGGKGSAVGTYVGVLFITIISNILNLMNVSWYYISIFKGALILLASMADILKTWKRGER
ncbi:MAG: ABC transporter permease [Spirochaetota bacterium]